VRVTERFTVERYSHVMHIVSNVEGKLKDGLDALAVLRATFPAGTVSGAPKLRAMEIIDELEPTKRGIYAGSAGYIGFHGDMDLAIAIRTAVVKDGMIHVQAGAGIVADSDPAEWQETQSRLAPRSRRRDRRSRPRHAAVSAVAARAMQKAARRRPCRAARCAARVSRNAGPGFLDPLGAGGTESVPGRERDADLRLHQPVVGAFAAAADVLTVSCQRAPRPRLSWPTR
jgi:hypothetical protein